MFYDRLVHWDDQEATADKTKARGEEIETLGKSGTVIKKL